MNLWGVPPKAERIGFNRGVALARVGSPTLGDLTI